MRFTLADGVGREIQVNEILSIPPNSVMHDELSLNLAQDEAIHTATRLIKGIFNLAEIDT